MDISDIIPKDGKPQRIYCNKCNTHTEIAYDEFNQVVSGVAIRIQGLPVLRCPECGHDQLPDRSRFAIVQMHREACERSLTSMSTVRRKPSERFDFTDVPFMYDTDDYSYFPGLYRPFDVGYLQPVFFRRRVLFKYDNAPGYKLKFASTTYGQIDTEDTYISFGINRHGHVVMWLGDIAKLPKEEQYYLCSENIDSDHALGSEFYDGQIEVVFTPLAKEDELFRLRSNFLNKGFERFGVALGHLEAETFDLALSFNPPVIDTSKERRHVVDTLNKIYLESLDNTALQRIVDHLGTRSSGSGSLKRLQAILQALAPNNDVSSLMTPLYVLYDLRVVYSHLTSDSGSTRLADALKHLGLEASASLSAIYGKLLDGLIECFEGMTKIIADNYHNDQ